MLWTSAQMIVMAGCALALGYGTACFVHGGNICYDCWLALILGRRFENGCNSCGVKLHNDRITH